MQVFMAALGVFVLVRASALSEGEVGTVFAVVAYYWNFTMAFDDVPALVQQVAHLRDVGRRLQSVPSDLDPSTSDGTGPSEAEPA